MRPKKSQRTPPLSEPVRVPQRPRRLPGEGLQAAGKQEKPRRSSWAWPWSKKVDPAPAEGSPAPSESASSCPSAQGDVKTMGGAVMQPFPLSMHRNATTGAVMTGTAPGTLIACSGWIVDDEDFVRPWRGLRDDSWDAFALCWEPAAVRAVGNAMMSMIAKEASKEAAKWFVSTYVSAGLIASLAWPIFILNAAGQIDNAWTLAMDRADQAGKLLACILAEGLNGGRPVTLVGYSLGGKLVFECLCELDRMGSRGLVEHAIILGAPVNGNLARWAAARRVVSGRLVNGYSSWDWLLAVAYRSGFSTTPTTQFYQQVAGLSHISARGVQNINLGDHIGRHTDYVAKMPELLKLVGLEEQHGCRDGSTQQTP